MEKAKYKQLAMRIFFMYCCILSALLFSCIRNTVDVVPADTTKRWLGYRQNSDDTILTKNGYTYLTTHNGISANGTAIISNNKLKGDFEVKIKYSSFVTSGNYSFSDQLIFNFSAPGVRDPLIGATLTNQNIYIEDSTRSSSSRNTVNRDGEVYVKRTGSTIYSWIRAGSDSLIMNRNDYYSGDLSIEMKVLSADHTSTHTAVHLDDIVVTGGGGFVKSNTFDEKTIRIVE